MNLFVVLLSIVLNTSYQLYYFVPLISFWFVVLTITFKIQLPFEVILNNACNEIGVNHPPRKKNDAHLFPHLNFAFKVKEDMWKMVWILIKSLLLIIIMTILYMHQVTNIFIYIELGKHYLIFEDVRK